MDAQAQFAGPSGIQGRSSTGAVRRGFGLQLELDFKLLTGYGHVEGMDLAWRQLSHVIEHLIWLRWTEDRHQQFK